ncbi:SMI1/KNR4 family protein [Capnocytophaga canimorsus]|nr:SMI1/KNR4 family protein [Capnocytophaga canimorsus]
MKTIMNSVKSIYPVSKSENLEKLTAFEQAYFNIPNDFREYLISYNVAKPRKTYYKGRVEFDLNYLFGFSKNAYEDFLETIKTYTNRTDKNLFPIGSVDGGDLLCMDKNTQEIYYWNHEINDQGLEGNNTPATKISANLDEFLESLTISSEPTEYEIKRAIQNAVVTTTPKGVEIRNEQRKKKGLRPLTIEEWHAKLNGIYDPDTVNPNQST